MRRYRMYVWLVFVVSVLCVGGMPTANSAQARGGVCST
jgi:hypothetical protein